MALNPRTRLGARALLAFCLIFAACSQGAPSQQSAREALWFEGARLIAGDGTEPVENSAILVENDTIQWVGRKDERQPPDGAARIDLAGKTIIPALIDGHNHVPHCRHANGQQALAHLSRTSGLQDAKDLFRAGIDGFVHTVRDSDGVISAPLPQLSKNSRRGHDDRLRHRWPATGSERMSSWPSTCSAG